jgi:hypothetical protein
MWARPNGLLRPKPLLVTDTGLQYFTATDIYHMALVMTNVGVDRSEHVSNFSFYARSRRMGNDL